MAEVKNGGQTDRQQGGGAVDGSGTMTELIFLLEQSGSMAELESDMIDGFNGMITQLREAGADILVWICRFADNCMDFNTRVPITAEVALLERDCFTRLRVAGEEYRRAHPESRIEQDDRRGKGELFGLMGGVIDLARQEYERTRPEDRPARTMFIIITDDMESVSRYYWTPDRLRELLQQQEAEGWEFIFLGTNSEAVEAVGEVGIRTSNAARFSCDSEGLRAVFHALAQMTSTFAETGVIAEDWQQEISLHLAESGRS